MPRANGVACSTDRDIVVVKDTGTCLDPIELTTPNSIVARAASVSYVSISLAISPSNAKRKSRSSGIKFFS